MKSLFNIFAFLLLCIQLSHGQHYYEDEFTAQPADKFVIDGVGDEAFWKDCDWYNLEYVWLPYSETMDLGDFTGRVKFAWTKEKLLVLAEIEDDVLSDTHTDPYDNYWNDDCFEIFLDEDYSGGWHQNNHNAFAYHCAINEEDVIDIGTTSTVNFKDHVKFDLDTIDATHYVWELALTIYNDSYDESNPTNTTVNLTTNKEMGIAIAYCDNDGGNGRENFIGLVDLNAEHENSAWQDASVFGKLTLAGTISGLEETSLSSNSGDILIYQDRNSKLIIQNRGERQDRTMVSIFDLNGRLVKESLVILDEITTMDIQDLSNGIYIVNLKNNRLNYSVLLNKNEL